MKVKVQSVILNSYVEDKVGKGGAASERLFLIMD